MDYIFYMESSIFTCSRTGDPRENCWKGEKVKEMAQYYFQGGNFLKLFPKASFLACKTFSFSLLLSSSSRLLFSMMSLASMND